jgi:hypothetical protein
VPKQARLAIGAVAPVAPASSASAVTAHGVLTSAMAPRSPNGAAAALRGAAGGVVSGGGGAAGTREGSVLGSAVLGAVLVNELVRSLSKRQSDWYNGVSVGYGAAIFAHTVQLH